MTDLPASERLLRYFQIREQHHADQVAAALGRLTDRERALVREAAVMGFVRGAIFGGGGREVPRGRRTRRGSAVTRRRTYLDARVAQDRLLPQSGPRGASDVRVGAGQAPNGDSVKILSVDAETNGLYGRPFCVGAVCTDDGGPTEVFTARCTIDEPVDPWVQDNVLPALADIPVHWDQANSASWAGDPYTALLADFADWFDAHKGGATVIAHVGVPVEARLFADMVRLLDRGPFSGPFPLHDLATLLHAVGCDPASADGYLLANGLAVPNWAATSLPHNPLYDAVVAEVAWRHLLDRLWVPRG